MFKTKFNSISGMTLLEVLITIAIMIVISAITFYSIKGVGRQENLSKNVLTAISYLDQARSSTLSSKDSSQFGVHFETDKIVLFKGASYSEVDPSNITTELDKDVEISLISIFDGGSDVVFKRLTGETLNSGTIKFSLKTDSTKSKTITIFPTGINQSN